MKRCPACGEENPDRAKFCLACATPLPENGAPARELRKIVTVVFSDVTGSTALGEQLDPESLRRVMSRYFDAMRAVIERHGGTVEKFIGDAVMAVFGIPRVHEDDALRAVRAAAEMRDELGRLNDVLRAERGVELAVRTGVNTGEVVAGDATAGQGFATGDAVNVAARLEQAASPGEILLGATTQGLVRDAVEVEPLDPLSVKGKAEPLAAFRLLEVRPEAAGRARRLDSPLVGRERERRLLRGALERMLAENACHLFTVLGAAGVGKSRLVADFLEQAGDSARIVRGRCLSYGEGITYWPLEEALGELTDCATSAEIAAALPGLLADEPEAELIASRLAGLLGAADATASAQEGAWATRRLLEAIARRTPLVVLFDDIHWAEPTFLDLIEHIADLSRDAPILLLCVARPELLDARRGWGGDKFNATTVLLEPLGDEDTAGLVANLVDGAALPAAVTTRIIAAAEGNPLFVEELVGMLVDDGLLRRETGGWTARGDLTKLQVPPTIQALLAARLDRLRAEEREAAEAAAVEGKVFHAGAVQELVPPERRIDVEGALLGLLRRDLVRPNEAAFAGEEAFRFRHQLIRDAAYEALPKDARAELHERFVEWLDGLGYHHDEIVGFHLEQAARYRRELSPHDPRAAQLGGVAAKRLAAAGRAALGRGDRAATGTLLHRAAKLTENRSERAPLLFEAAYAYYVEHEWARAVPLLDEAAAEARAAGDRAVELRATLVRELCTSRVDPSWTSAQLERVAEEIIHSFSSPFDHAALADAFHGLTEVHLERCNWADSAAAAEQTLTHAGAADDQLRASSALMNLANALYWGPTPAAAAVTRCEEIRSQLAEIGFSVEEAHVSYYSGGLEAMGARFDEARSMFLRGRAVLEERGALHAVATKALVSGEALAFAGDTAAAEREITDACAYLAGIGETGVFSTLAGMLAGLLADQGRWDDAEGALAEAERTTSRDDLASVMLLHAVRGRVLAARGDLGAAESSARTAVQIAEATDFLVLQGDAYSALGEVLVTARRVDEARGAFEQAIARYRSKGHEPAVARVERTLAAVG